MDGSVTRALIHVVGRPADIGRDTGRRRVAMPYVALNRVNIWQMPIRTEARMMRPDTIRMMVLGSGDGDILRNVAPDVFDGPVRADLAREFLDDPRHHIAVARDEDLVVGFASAVHYVHPDKDPELWIDEVGVAPTHQGRGIGKALLQEMLALGRRLGCVTAWVLAERDNLPALRLYTAVGGREPSTETVLFTFELAGDPPG